MHRTWEEDFITKPNMVGLRWYYRADKNFIQNRLRLENQKQ